MINAPDVPCGPYATPTREALDFGTLPTVTMKDAIRPHGPDPDTGPDW